MTYRLSYFHLKTTTNDGIEGEEKDSAPCERVVVVQDLDRLANGGDLESANVQVQNKRHFHRWVLPNFDAQFSVAMVNRPNQRRI